MASTDLQPQGTKKGRAEEGGSSGAQRRAGRRAVTLVFKRRYTFIRCELDLELRATGLLEAGPVALGLYWYLASGSRRLAHFSELFLQGYTGPR